MASVHRVFKLSGTACLVGAAALVGLAAEVRGQAPDEAWRTLTTEHFRVTFPDRLEALGRRAAARAEVAYVGLRESFLEPRPGRIDLLVSDHTDESNGFAQVRPSNRITVFARPPVDGVSLTYFDDWLELVITHELAHIFQLDHTGTPLGRLSRSVFGRAGSRWPSFPGVGTPGWVIEGLATWYESRLTTAGRVHGTFHEMVLRTAVLEGRFEHLGEASGQSPLWPGGSRPYAYGSLFFDHLLGRYGDDRLTALAEAVAGQWVPYRLDAAGRSAFGVSLSDAWREWAAELTARYDDLDAELAWLGPVTEPERLTTDARWAFHPSVSPDGRTLVYARADGRSDIQLRKGDPAGGPTEALARTNGLATYGWMPDGRLLVSQLEYADPYRSYGDLYLMDLEGASRRLTRGARLTQPSAAPDGTWAVAVQEGDGTNGLVRIELGTGAISTLVAPSPDVHWAFPRLSPDGRWIAATRWEPESYHDVVILDAVGRGEMRRVTHDRAVDLAPSWTPDSRWIVWSSDRTGVMNILGALVDPVTGRASPPRLLTNVRTGVTYPSVDPSGRWLYVSGYHVDGWEAERVPFDPDAFGPAPPPVERFEPPTSEPVPRGQATGPVEDYSSLSTLLPRYWEPRYREPVVAPATQAGGLVLPRKELLGFGLGAQTAGSDLVGRHAYAVQADVSTSGGKVGAGGAYSYRGFGNPILSLRAEQSWNAAGQLLAGSAPDTAFVLERGRNVDASLTFLSNRWRRRFSVTLGGGLVWEARELLGSDLEPSRLYGLAAPTSRLGELRAALNFSTARTHSFQMGAARGLNVFVQGRTQRHLGLRDVDLGIVGIDRSLQDVVGRVSGYVPLWRAGYATHVLAVQASGGSGFGPGAALGHFGVGGASGSTETVTGLELFGGSYVFLPVRGYPRSARFGRYAWAASAEYRFPLVLVNRGLGAWPLHLDRLAGSVFFDAGNAWDPNPLGTALASVGAEVTLQVLGFYDAVLQLRTGLAVPLVDGAGARVYVRAGVPF